MKKNSKKALATTMCTVMMLGAVAPIVSAKAEGINGSYSASLVDESQYIDNIDWSESTYDKVVGKFKNDNQYITTKGSIKDGTLSGSIYAEITVKDLFGSMRRKFNDEYQFYKGLVMFSENGTKPVMKYTINFPDGVKINTEDINFNINTDTVSLDKIEGLGTNSITIIFNVGKWSDYENFFNMVANEEDNSDKKISFSVNYKLENATESNYTATGYGKCSLWYWGRWEFLRNEIIKIYTENRSLNLVNNSNVQ